MKIVDKKNLKDLISKKRLFKLNLKYYNLMCQWIILKLFFFET